MQGVCLALQARRLITAWGNAPGVCSQTHFSAESAIQSARGHLFHQWNDA